MKSPRTRAFAVALFVFVASSLPAHAGSREGDAPVLIKHLRKIVKVVRDFLAPTNVKPTTSNEDGVSPPKP